MILLFAGFVSAATVTITPSAPTDKDNLVCDVAGSSGNYIYKWFKNGQFYLQSASAVQSHTLSSSFTSAGDKWTCKAYTPPIPIFGMIYKGEASVTIGQNSPEPTPPDNHSPYWRVIEGDKSVCAGDLVSFTLAASDPDGDRITYSVSPNIGSLCSWNGLYQWRTGCSDVGVHTLTFKASDGKNYVTQNVKITVNSCGRCGADVKPILNPINDKHVCPGDHVKITATAQYNGNDVLHYYVSRVPPGGYWNEATHTLNWFPTVNDIGKPQQISFWVEDQHCNSDSESVTIYVDSCGMQNHAPVLNPIENKQVCAGKTLSFYVSATDQDNDILTYSLTGKPNGAYWSSATRFFSWTPTLSDVGSHYLTFSVSDGKLSDSERIRIDVVDCTPKNHAPVIKDVPDKTVCEGEHLRFNVMATDADGDALTYSASNLPTGATFTGQTFDWTPKDGQDGIYYVTFRVSDGSLSDSTTAKITVKNCIVNHAPVLTPIGDKEICKGKTLSFMVSATDQDGDSLTYSAFGLPSGATFTNKRFTWTPQYTGTYYVTFSVSDGELSDSETVKITVKNCNHCPVLESIPTQTICAESTLNLQLIASDLDGDSLTYSGTPLPFGSSLCSWNGVFSWTPTCSQLGTYDITFKVTDGQCDDSKTAKIIVKDCGACNHAPVISIPDKTMNEGETLTINLDDYSSDIDGDDLTYTLISGVGAVSGKTYTYYANYQSSGDYTVTIQANDGRGGIAGTSFTIHVNNVPRKPTADFTFTPDAPKINEQVTFNASLSSDPDGNELTYSWDFNNDGITDATGVIVQHSFSEAKCYNVTLTVSNGYKQDSKTKQVCTTYKGKIEVKSIHCFDRVIINSKQSCSAELNIKTEAELKFYDYDTDSYIGSCYSDRLTGACTLNFDVHQLGTYKVYVKAYKNGYLPDEDKIPYDEYEVIKKRYEIEMLKVYNDTDYSNEDYDFFRGQTMYVRFMVKDLINNEYVDNVVTSASLVSPPGGRAELIKYKPNENHYYYYYLTIPPTHGFLGTSQVFAFAFNFSDNSGGEAYVDLTIRNNPPEILPIPDQSMETNSVLQLDLSSYKRDVEDSGDNLRWEVYGNNDFTASIDRDLLTIYSKNSIASTYFTLKLFDLDNNSDMVNVGLDIHPKKYPPIANPNGPYRFSPGEEIQFDSSGSRDPDGGSLSYEWSFGDGSISHEANPKHTYSQEGIYTVTLTVTDDEGEKTTAETHAYIEKKAEQQPRTTKDDLIIKNLVIGHKNIVSGSFIPVFFTVENSGPEDIKRAEITFLVRELGLKRVYRNVNIDSGKEVSKFFVFRNPGITGKFTMMVHIRQGDIERTKFVEFEIR